MKRWALSLVITAALGCGEPDSQGEGGRVAGEGGGGAGVGGGVGGDPGEDPYAPLYACEEVGFAEQAPLSGPGYDAETGFVGTPQSSYVVHTTQIYIRPDKQGEFFLAAGKVANQLATTEGLVAFAVGTDDGCGVARTMGVWTSEEALYAFVGSGAHADAMAKTADLSFTGRTTHWDATPEDVQSLTWDVARAKLDAVDHQFDY